MRLTVPSFRSKMRGVFQFLELAKINSTVADIKELCYIWHNCRDEEKKKKQKYDPEQKGKKQ